MQRLVDDLNLTTEKIKLGKLKIQPERMPKDTYRRVGFLGGGEAARKRHLSRKKMLPRDRYVMDTSWRHLDLKNSR